MQLAIGADGNRTLDLDPEAVRATFEPFGLAPAEEQDIEPGRAWAARMIGPGVAAPQVLARVHRRMGRAALFLRREGAAITGMLAWIALNGAGLEALLQGRFSGTAPDDAHIAGPREPFVACYGWGIAGGHKEASRAVLRACAAMNDELFPATPLFTRASTPDGRRVMVERFHYEPAPCPDPDLFWRRPIQERAA